LHKPIYLASPHFKRPDEPSYDALSHPNSCRNGVPSGRLPLSPYVSVSLILPINEGGTPPPLSPRIMDILSSSSLFVIFAGIQYARRSVLWGEYGEFNQCLWISGYLLWFVNSTVGESNRGGRVILCDTGRRCALHAKFLPSIETNFPSPTYRKTLTPIMISHMTENISLSLRTSLEPVSGFPYSFCPIQLGLLRELCFR